MNDETTLLEYRIRQDGDKFVAFDSMNDIVGCYDTEEDANTDVERAKLEDAIFKHAKILFHASIVSVMGTFDVDRERARYWIATAAECR
jgi:hypothetical protein